MIGAQLSRRRIQVDYNPFESSDSDGVIQEDPNEHRLSLFKPRPSPEKSQYSSAVKNSSAKKMETSPKLSLRKMISENF